MALMLARWKKAQVSLILHSLSRIYSLTVTLSPLPPSSPTIPSLPPAIGYVCDMVGSSLEMMEECLTVRSVHTKRDFVQKPLSEAEVR